jgi:hypothetical protein
MLLDYAALPANTFSIHEAAFLQEKQVEFNRSGNQAGRFSVNNNSEFRRIEDKVMFLIAKFGDGTIDKGSRLWQKFEKVKKKRNALTHYRKTNDIEITTQDLQEAIDLTKELIDFLSRKVWRKPVNW